jgi:hypothetical protein
MALASPMCPNCDKEVNGKYCAYCGQKFPQQSDFQLKEILRQAVTEITDLDGTLWRTLYYLFRYPGRLTYDYLHGKQKQYINPFKLYLFASLLYFFVFTYRSKATIVDLDVVFQLDLYGGTEAAILSLWNPDKQGREEFLESFIQETRDVNSLLLYSSILFCALFLKLWYFRRKIPYAVHLLFALHFLSFGFIREVILFPLMVYFKPVMIVLLAIHSLWYLYFAVKLCYPQTKLRIFLNAFLIYLGFAFIFINNLFMAIYFTIQFWE